jgi:hypothetical protein
MGHRVPGHFQALVIGVRSSPPALDSVKLRLAKQDRTLPWPRVDRKPLFLAFAPYDPIVVGVVSIGFFWRPARSLERGTTETEYQETRVGRD